MYGEGDVPLHRPVFVGNEKAYLCECIDSNFVSSVGTRITQFEKGIAAYMGAAHAVATVNGTAALHTALILEGVSQGEEVITQALTFVATANSISYVGARPIFLDVDRDTLGLSPDALENWLGEHAEVRGDQCFNRRTGARIAAVVPMHTFGIPCRISKLVEVSSEFHLPVIEDAAEALGSFVEQRHTGIFGTLSTLSFNGNKIMTTGGGGMIVTQDPELASRGKHLTTTAKKPHAWHFVHDETGYNYRLPNLNAALGCAQLEKLPTMLAIKAEVAQTYAAFCQKNGLQYVKPPQGTQPNHWLNAIILESEAERDAFLEHTTSRGIMTRPVWRLMTALNMFKDCENDSLANSHWLAQRLVNIPSSVPDSKAWKLTQ